MGFGRNGYVCLWDPVKGKEAERLWNGGQRRSWLRKTTYLIRTEWREAAFGPQGKFILCGPLPYQPYIIQNFIIGVKLLYNAVLVSAMQQSESAICIHIFLPFQDKLVVNMNVEQNLSNISDVSSQCWLQIFSELIWRGMENDVISHWNKFGGGAQYRIPLGMLAFNRVSWRSTILTQGILLKQN